ncbi:MAG: hypothetical protein AAB436_01540 [Patescibacteria group bacterium]
MFFSRESGSRSEVPAPDEPEVQVDSERPEGATDDTRAPSGETSNESRERFRTQVAKAREARTNLPPIKKPDPRQ